MADSKEPKTRVFSLVFCRRLSVGLAVARARLASRVVLVETDDRVVSVWRTILYGDWKAGSSIHFHFSVDT